MVGQIFSDAREAINYLKSGMLDSKASERRQKLLDDMQRIQSQRKNNDPYIPDLPGHDQEAWLAKLDDGIWKHVFQFITDPSDVTNAYFACELFRKHLEEKRILMLLPQVFDVLRDKEHLIYCEFPFNPFPAFIAERWKEMGMLDIQRQRLVSKAWKKLAEEAFLEPLAFSRNTISQGKEWVWVHSPIKLAFTTTEDITRCLEKLGSSSSSASLIRAIRVDDAECSNKELFYTKLAQFLRIQGENLWGLRWASNELNYSTLSELVAMMPHLKALSLDVSWTPPDDDDTAPSREFYETALALLNSEIVRNPFPTLPELQQLTVESYPYHSELLIAEVASKNPSLKAVHLSRWNVLHGNVIPQFVWEVLGKLRLETFDFGYVERGELSIDDFLALKKMDWPLRFLRVEYHDRGDEFEINAKEVLNILHHFKDSLIEFRLEFVNDGAVLRNDKGSFVVDCPKLETLICPEFVE